MTPAEIGMRRVNYGNSEVDWSTASAFADPRASAGRAALASTSSGTFLWRKVRWPQHQRIYQLDCQSVQPHREVDTGSTIFSLVDELLDPSRLSDEAIFSSLVNTDLTYRSQPRHRRKAIFVVVGRRRGKPSFSEPSTSRNDL